MSISGSHAQTPDRRPALTLAIEAARSYFPDTAAAGALADTTARAQMARRAFLFAGNGTMPDGLVKIMIWGTILFFFGAMIMGWVYG